jgi:hypothetical protein
MPAKQRFAIFFCEKTRSFYYKISRRENSTGNFPGRTLE